MKNCFKKINLIGLSLLGTFLIVCLINITNGQTIIYTNSGDNEHKIRLHSLFLWNNPGSGSLSMKINTGEKFLRIDGGLAIGNNHTVESGVVSSVIGGGNHNKLNGNKYSGIVGGQNNTINNNADNSIIGGGQHNTINNNADNAVIGGGKSNTIETNSSNSTILGGERNEINGENSIILGGRYNKTNGKNSLVFGQYSEGETGSFVFGIGNQSNKIIGKENSARIDAKSGVLIGTINPINKVKLVINGTVSLTGQSNLYGGIGGEIRVVNGCIYAHDGNHWQVMGKSSESTCGDAINTCQFGNTILYSGDRVIAYTNFWANNCHNIEKSATCSNGRLIVPEATNKITMLYPYCYDVN